MYKLNQIVKSFTTLFLLIIITLLLSNCGYKKSESGIEYRILKNGSGNKVKNGDYVKLHFIRVFGDSVGLDSHKGEPETLVYKDDIGKGQRFNFMDIIGMAKKGDSIVLRLAYDSIFKDQANKPPFYKKGGFMKMFVTIVDVYSEEQAKKDAEEKLISRNKELSEKAKKEKPLIEEFVSKNNLKGVFSDLGVFISLIKEGKGSTIKKDTLVGIKYTGKTLEGKTFDSNIGKPEKPLLTFKVGLGQLIPGFDNSLLDLKKGSTVRIIIPSVLAYGDKAVSEALPANSILDFYIEIVQ